MVISTWNFIKPIFIIPPWNRFFYKHYFLILPGFPHSEYWYVFMDVNKTNQMQSTKLWGRHREREKKAQSSHEGKYVRECPCSWEVRAKVVRE